MSALSPGRCPDMTAMYVLNNTLCGSVLLELKKRDMKTPDDISLLTWDDDEINELFDITTVVQRVDEIGKRAVNRLFELMENPQSPIYTQQVSTQLVIRKSCGTPRNETGGGKIRSIVKPQAGCYRKNKKKEELVWT